MPVVRIALALLISLVSLSVTGPAHSSDQPSAAGSSAAGPPGKWTDVSQPETLNITRPGLHRTADGVLHMFYTREVGTTDSLMHLAISRTGKTLFENTVVEGWASLPHDPVAVAAPGGGIRVIFGGIRTTADPADFWSDGRLYTAVSDASGATWTLPAEAVGTSQYGYASYGTGATTLADGTPVAAYPLNSEITYHVGTLPTPDSVFTVADCCAYDMTLVREGDTVYATWYGNGDTADTNGIFVRSIHPVLGPIMKAPGSSQGTSSLDPSQKVAMVAREGGGVYLAYCVGYPTCKYAGLWRLGSGKARKVPGSKGLTQLALSAGPGGRLWVAWNSPDDTIMGLRTATNGQRFGAVQSAGRPKGEDTIYAVALEGSSGRGDVVANTGADLFHSQLLAGLTLKASPKRWAARTAKTVDFKVTDAGVAVKGAKVKAAGKSCKTDKQGTCSIHFPAMGAKKLKATATAPEYGRGTVTLKIG